MTRISDPSVCPEAQWYAIRRLALTSDASVRMQQQAVIEFVSKGYAHWVIGYQQSLILSEMITVAVANMANIQ